MLKVQITKFFVNAEDREKLRDVGLKLDHDDMTWDFDSRYSWTFSKCELLGRQGIVGLGLNEGSFMGVVYLLLLRTTDNQKERITLRSIDLTQKFNDEFFEYVDNSGNDTDNAIEKAKQELSKDLEVWAQQVHSEIWGI